LGADIYLSFSFFYAEIMTTITMTMSMSTFLPLFLLWTCLFSFVTNTANACLVLDANDVDITIQVLEDEDSDKIPTVICSNNGTNRSICNSALIHNCPKVKCLGQEACTGAFIENFTHEVICDGLHACHKTRMVAASGERVEFARNVVCQGSGACNVAIIDSNDAQAMNVVCLGSKACRKANIQTGEGTVTCAAGSTTSYQACEGSSIITAKCLICQENGCGSAINRCKYQTSINDPFVKCEGTVGACQELNNTITLAQQEEQDELAGGQQDDQDNY
jgi:hypothetical protein